ncbi:4Fe-4S cluster-binding domain-containing protein [Streptomyces sp. NPDC060198]|uniref:4Fe-4S cluster-binding domain-containing protein n=1 Tax=Streptomyces sp. NPDC060198 TaxID=3347070 RepID=UPI00365DB7A8
MFARIGGTHFPLETLGPGRRLGIWFQGCSLACGGCMSRHTWDARGGTSQDVAALLGLWERALADGAEGLTVSGGEPLQQPDALAELLAGAAAHRDGDAHRAANDRADLLVYTGYEFGEMTPRQAGALRHADAVITGRFRVAEPTALVWRGSANQTLRPLTGRARARYAPHLAREAPAPRLQAVVDSGADGPGMQVYGVPLRGELRDMERRLKDAGVRLRNPSWRP